MNLPTHPGDPDFLLRRVLQANAVFSTLSGLLWVGGGEALGRWFGRDGSMAADGAGLLVFAVLLAILSTRTRIPVALAWVVVVLDVLWVVDAAVQVAGGRFSTGGSWIMGAICLIVLGFAALQVLGIVRGARQRRAEIQVGASAGA